MSDSLLTEPYSDIRGFSLFLTISVIAHVTLLTAAVLFPQGSGYQNRFPEAIHVELIAGVSLPGGGAASAPDAPAVHVEKTAPSIPSVPSADDFVFRRNQPLPAGKTASSRPETKTSLKSKTYKPSEVVKSAVARMEKRISDDSPQVLSNAIDRIRQQVAGSQTGSGGGRSGQPGSGFGHSTGTAITQIDIYRTEINFYIKQNWNFSEHLAGGRKGLEVSYWIRIQKNGEIDKITIDKSSGNRYMDESAYRAIIRSNPLPPLPESYPYSYYEVPLKFDPSELHRQ